MAVQRMLCANVLNAASSCPAKSKVVVMVLKPFRAPPVSLSLPSWLVAHTCHACLPCLQVVAYYAPQFAELRRRCVAGGEAAYLASLSRCRKWASRGGKSNVYFAKTRDDRYGRCTVLQAEQIAVSGDSTHCMQSWVRWCYDARRAPRRWPLSACVVLA